MTELTTTNTGLHWDNKPRKFMPSYLIANFLCYTFIYTVLLRGVCVEALTLYTRGPGFEPRLPALKVLTHAISSKDSAE